MPVRPPAVRLENAPAIQRSKTIDNAMVVDRTQMRVLNGCLSRCRPAAAATLARRHRRSHRRRPPPPFTAPTGGSIFTCTSDCWGSLQACFRGGGSTQMATSARLSTSLVTPDALLQRRRRQQHGMMPAASACDRGSSHRSPAQSYALGGKHAPLNHPSHRICNVIKRPVTAVGGPAVE